MPGYISEIDYYGTTDKEFLEIALPAGTDPSGYTVQLYYNDGAGNGIQWASFPIGTSVATIGGQDVYVIDSATTGWDSGDGMGNLYTDDAVALVDGSGTVQQFISWEGNVLTGSGGAADGLTSTEIGTIAAYDDNHSMQSDNGGASYYSQSASNKNTIPACYARGTRIATPDGERRIETLKVGDLVCTADGNPVEIRWLWRRMEHFDRPDAEFPMRFTSECLGAGRPQRSLVVSAQHRIAVGFPDQLANEPKALVPAKALANLAGVHVMHARKSIQWWHIVCDRHVLLLANGIVSESMLLGPQMYRAFTREERAELRRALPDRHTAFRSERPALRCLKPATVRRKLARANCS